MLTTLTHALRALVHLLVCGPQRAWLSYVIWETEAYLADCERDGLIESLHVTQWRAEVADMRVRLALLQQPRATTNTARA